MKAVAALMADSVDDVLPRFALALVTPLNSGSEMERGLSVGSDIYGNGKRNSMSHETLESHMQIRYEAKEACNKMPNLCKKKTNCTES